VVEDITVDVEDIAAATEATPMKSSSMVAVDADFEAIAEFIAVDVETAPDRHDAVLRLCFDCGSPHHMRGDASCPSVWQGVGGGHHQGPLRVTFNQDQPLEDAQAQAFITDHNTENGHFSEIDECDFASRVCCLVSSHCLPDDIHVVPAYCTIMILPPDARSLSTASCVTSGAVADTGNDRGVTNNH